MNRQSDLVNSDIDYSVLVVARRGPALLSVR